MALLAGLGHDLGFTGVLLGVEHAVRDVELFQALGEHFRGLDGDGAHQHGLALFVQLADGLDDGIVLFLAGTVDEVGVVLALHGLVGRDGDHFQIVDLVEFHGFGIGRTGHARQLVIHAEIVLEGDGGQGLVLGGDGDVFLGFQGLVQTVGIAAAVHEAARELVHDDHLVVLHDVVHVALEDVMGLQGLQDAVLLGDVGRVEEVVHMQQGFAVGHAFLGEHGGAGFFIHGVVFGAQLAHDLVHGAVHAHAFVGSAGDDERGTGLVDEDGVHFVHDGEVVAALHQLRGVELHVVAQIVEAELVVGTVGDVGAVGFLAGLVVKTVDDDAHGKAQEVVELAHPLGVAGGQVVVDGHHMHALAGKGIEGHGQGGH